jgi:hypothetical protein
MSYTNYSGFLRLHEEYNWSVNQIAECVNKSPEYIQEVFDELSMQPQGLRRVPVLDEHLTPAKVSPSRTPEMKKKIEEAREKYCKTVPEIPERKTVFDKPGRSGNLSKKRLVRKLKKSGLTGKAIAERLGMSQGMVSQLLNRKRKSLGRRKLLVRA